MHEIAFEKMLYLRVIQNHRETFFPRYMHQFNLFTSSIMHHMHQYEQMQLAQLFYVLSIIVRAISDQSQNRTFNFNFEYSIVIRRFDFIKIASLVAFYQLEVYLNNVSLSKIENHFQFLISLTLITYDKDQMITAKRKLIEFCI